MSWVCVLEEERTVVFPPSLGMGAGRRGARRSLLTKGCGGRQVRDVQESLGKVHPVINDLFHLCVRAKIHGFTR